MEAVLCSQNSGGQPSRVTRNANLLCVLSAAPIKDTLLTAEVPLERTQRRSFKMTSAIIAMMKSLWILDKRLYSMLQTRRCKGRPSQVHTTTF